MCQKGVNKDQLRLMIEQTDDTIALSQAWLERIHHLADHADDTDASALLAQATVLLGEVRGKLESASERLQGTEGTPGVSVELA